MVTVGQNRHRVEILDEMGPDFQVMMETFNNFWTIVVVVIIITIINIIIININIAIVIIIYVIVIIIVIIFYWSCRQTVE